ncbi:ornithine aminotransferase [Thioclava sp. F42-5]|uniref:BON domain-containing protein n=1 Tax=Thioclava sp. F42-5 TaxID=1973005 RepID=UPI000B542765|nr:BON domain-containing protein [Thioclava sp. F42-5]OWY10492.1 ornithine aminotransferase [Thioclava sp. F42-5]
MTENLKTRVIEALAFDPSLHADDIAVSEKDGIVSLHGHVPTYAEKLATERIVGRIRGVRGLAQELEVRPAGQHVTADDEIAKRAVQILRWNTAIPDEALRVKVQKGFLTLEGDVEWDYQRKAAESALHGIAGVTGIANHIVIARRPSPDDVRERIEKALKRDAELDALSITVRVEDGVVTLDGKVDCLADRRVVERAAWAAPGVHMVEDHLRVS